ncbi:MAG: hypothetical protein D6693_07365 [Planctomycetota bacterium]|nr:MAG: hypothetical protein D6693_07365 [Planctomycetota bacterium]
MMASALPLTTASDAWPSLAKGAGLAPADAFDALLGRWVLGVADRGDGPVRWCIASAVARPVAVRLLGSLGAKPAAIEAGRPIAQIENGRFVVAALLRDDHAVLLLAPRASGALFGDTLARLAGRAPLDSLADDERFARVADSGADSAPILALFRTESPPADEGREPESVWTSLTVDLSGMTARLDLTVAPAPADGHGLILSPDGWVQASRGAVVAVMEPASAENRALGGLLGALEIEPALALAPIHGQVGLFLTEPEPGRLALALAAQTQSRDRLAPVADTVLARVAAYIADGSIDAYATLDGAYPATARRLRVPLDDGAREWLGWLAPPSGPLTLAWSIPRAGPEPSAGWWVAATDELLHDRLAHVLPANGVGDAGAEAPDTFLSIRPRRLVELLAHLGVVEAHTASVLDGLALVESIDGVGRYTDGAFRLTAAAKLLPPDDE